MLHAVAARVRQVVGEESVVPRLVLRILVEDRPFLLDDLLDVLHQAVELDLCVRVMHREAKLVPTHFELAQRDGPELDRAVHEVLQVGRGQYA